MSCPPRKKLKQATILEGFAKQKSVTEATGPKKQQKDKDSVDLTEDSQKEEDMNTEKATTEEKVEGAEKRKRKMSLEEEAGTSNSFNGEKKLSPHRPASSSGDSALDPDSQPSSWNQSQELFSDSDQPEPDKSSPCAMGTSRLELNSQPACSLVLPLLKPSPMHTVLIHCGEGKLKQGIMPQPYPNSFHDKWDKDYVRMPCSKENLYPNGYKKEKRWALVEKALNAPINNSWDLAAAILKYNSRQKDSWNFDSLHEFFLTVTEEEREHFFKEVLPKMVELALNLPRICTGPVPLLKKGIVHKVTLSQKQAASLLANAFFCTFPRRNTHKHNAEFSSYPDINFNVLFMNGYDRQAQKLEKIKCIITYFSRVTKEMPTGVLTFKRQLIHDPPQWENSQATLTRLHVTSSGTIEDEGEGMLQVDFANKYVGGGVLGRGCVQEEIRFLICPELILSRLFTEVLEDNECLIMTGAERFSSYTGYAQSFKWSGPYTDPTPRDAWCRRYTEIVAIDAICYRHENQFGRFYVHRELDKAYCGFCYIPEATACDIHDDVKRKHSPAVATGNWGCGAFGGDVRLKALLQWMAAAEAGRDVCYFTFQNSKLVKELFNMHKYIVDKRITVSELVELIQQYYSKYRSSYNKPDLYSFICHTKEGGDLDTLDFDEDSREGWVDNSQELYAATP